MCKDHIGAMLTQDKADQILHIDLHRACSAFADLRTVDKMKRIIKARYIGTFFLIV